MLHKIIAHDSEEEVLVEVGSHRNSRKAEEDDGILVDFHPHLVEIFEVIRVEDVVDNQSESRIHETLTNRAKASKAP